MISLFIGGLIDPICAESESCPISTMPTEYVDIMIKVFGRNARDKWTAADIKKLRTDIQQFKVNGVSVFRDYKKSEIGTVQWHVLDPDPDVRYLQRLFPT